MSKKLTNIGLSLFEFSIVLIIASAIVRLSSSLYLPSLIDIGNSLNMSENALGFTLTIFFISYSIATLFVGPFVDYYGRKELILIGSVVFIFGSVLCSLAESSFMLFSGRVFQAIGTSAIPVSARAMIREYCDDIEVIKVLGWLAGIGSIIPILAPALGGIITEVFGWRYNFYLLVILSLMIVTYAYKKLPKSIKKSSTIHISYVLKSYTDIIISPSFIIIILPLALSFALQGVFLISTPFIFMKTYHLSAFEYGLTNIVVASGILFGRYVALFCVERYSSYFAYIFGSFLTLFGGVVIFFLIFFNFLTVSSLLFALFISVLGFGTLLPVGIKTIMTTFEEKSGMVSALHGFITLASMAIGSYMASLFKDSFEINYTFILCFGIIILGVSMSIVSISSKNIFK